MRPGEQKKGPWLDRAAGRLSRILMSSFVTHSLGILLWYAAGWLLSKFILTLWEIAYAP